MDVDVTEMLQSIFVILLFCLFCYFVPQQLLMRMLLSMQIQQMRYADERVNAGPAGLGLHPELNMR